MPKNNITGKLYYSEDSWIKTITDQCSLGWMGHRSKELTVMLTDTLDNQNGFTRTCDHITVYFTFALYLSRRNVWLSLVIFVGMLGNFHMFS